MIEKKKQKSPPKKKDSQRMKKKFEKLKVKDSNASKKSLLEQPEPKNSIISGHLDSLWQHPLAKWMRTEKIAFAIFLWLPEQLRWSQISFSKQWWISENSLCVWKLEPEVQTLRLQVMKSILLEKTPAVMDNLFEAASKKNSFWTVNTPAIKLWLQFIENWQESAKLDLNASGWFTINFGAWKSQFINPTDEQPLKESEKS